MIRLDAHDRGLFEGSGGAAARPWEGVASLSKIVFCRVVTDPAAELELVAPTGPEDAWERRRVACEDHDATAPFVEFARDRTVIAEDLGRLQKVLARLGLGLPETGCVDLADLRRLLGPTSLPRSSGGGALDARERTLATTGAVRAFGPARLAVIAHVFGPAQVALAREEPRAAQHLALLLLLVEHPSRFGGSTDEDGAFTRALADFPTLEDALEAALPPWTISRDADRPREPLAVLAEEEELLDAADRERVDAIFREHLPQGLTQARGEPAAYRAGQHGVAACIAEGFGLRELRLIYAPTGTGKTLAYLVPVLLWARRMGVRVGVATFTRALQEQAMEREVPLARTLLEQAGVEAELRVSVLKGRANYLCWRAFLLQTPAVDERGVDQLAWATLASFALSDATGDLDRLPRRRPLATLDSGEWRRASEKLLRLVRAESGCCSFAADRRTCAAEAARHRAERAHVVITNHAFALARREFFKHLVFDECEHLHDVAQSAFSHAVGLRALRELLERFYGGGREPLNRIGSLSPAESDVGQLCRDAVEARWRAGEAATELGVELAAFKAWRNGVQRTRTDRDHHSLFREYVEGPEAHALLAAHDVLRTSLGQLGAATAQMSELLEEALPARELPRQRRTLEILRLDLEDVSAGVEAWLPRGDGGQPAFRAETFYDVETSLNGEDVLTARVLLPQEVLGRRYYPDLGGAVLLSATTWLKGGFEAAATFLGLARAADPAPEEEREPCRVETFRAPEPFDYGRTVVCVPRDAPTVTDKDAFLDYTARFLGDLAEKTRGRLLALFTNADDLARVGRSLEPFFEERGIAFWWQRMSGTAKEELTELFRANTDSVLFGLDTFWYGADFPGETLEVLVIVRLPYGVPDRYHHAQCAVLGNSEQRRQIYLPRALAKFRQGFGRLMRRETDRGVIFVLDRRVLDPRHRIFLRELPVKSPFEAAEDDGAGRAPLIVGDTRSCVERALAHLDRSAPR